MDTQDPLSTRPKLCGQGITIRTTTAFLISNAGGGQSQLAHEDPRIGLRPSRAPISLNPFPSSPSQPRQEAGGRGDRCRNHPGPPPRSNPTTLTSSPPTTKHRCHFSAHTQPRLRARTSPREAPKGCARRASSPHVKPPERSTICPQSPFLCAPFSVILALQTTSQLLLRHAT